ncbi:MAG: Fe-S cluster assembly protein SufD [Pseudomonadota bacterium]
MTIAIAKTPAETTLGETFEQVASELPGNADTVARRKKAFGTFAALGLPHRRIEEWKYSDVRARVKEVGAVISEPSTTVSAADLEVALGPLAGIDAMRFVLVDGRHVPELSTGDADVLSATGEAADLSLAIDDSEALAALNLAMTTGGANVSVADGATVEKPILIVHLAASTDPLWTSTRNAISLGANAKATVVEVFAKTTTAAAGQSNAATVVRVGDGAHLTHIKVGVDQGATHLGTWQAEMGADSDYRPFFFTASQGFARNSLFLEFKGESARLDCSGCFLARGNEHIDNTLRIDHAVPGCESRELFKGVLDDNARGVFQGKVIVQQIAQKTDGKQMAQALMLSPTCEFDSKPELEIYADDVVCGHGSTCAELDPDLVFYLRARGISEPEARALLMESFVGEAIDQIESEPVAEALTEVAQHWLRALRAAA